MGGNWKGRVVEDPPAAGIEKKDLKRQALKQRTGNVIQEVITKGHRGHGGLVLTSRIKRKHINSKPRERVSAGEKVEKNKVV